MSRIFEQSQRLMTHSQQNVHLCGTRLTCGWSTTKRVQSLSKPFDTPRGIPYTADHVMGPIRGVVRK